MRFRAYNPIQLHSGKAAAGKQECVCRGGALHLKISTRQSGEVTIVDLHGNIVIGRDNDSLGERLQELTRQSVCNVLVDLTNVTQVDSSGISALVRAFISMQRSGGSFKMLHPSGHAREVLEVTHLMRFLRWMTKLRRLPASVLLQSLREGAGIRTNRRSGESCAELQIQAVDWAEWQARSRSRAIRDRISLVLTGCS